MKIKVAKTTFLPTNLSHHFSWWFYDAERHISALEGGIDKPLNRHNSCNISGEIALDNSKPQGSMYVGNKYHRCEKKPKISLLSLMSLIWCPCETHCGTNQVVLRHRIIQFPSSLGVSERASKWMSAAERPCEASRAEPVNEQSERMDERVAQYLRPNSWLFRTAVK